MTGQLLLSPPPRRQHDRAQNLRYGVIFDLFTRAGLALEHSKTELFHFSRARNETLPSVDLGYAPFTGTTPLTPKLYWRYLASTLTGSSSSMSMSGIILPRPSRPSWRWGCWVTLHAGSRLRSGGLSTGLVCCLLQHTGTTYGIIMAPLARAS